MSATESRIRLIFDGVERGVVAAAAKARAAVASLRDENNKIEKSFDTLDKGASKAATALLGIGKGLSVLAAGGSAVQVIGGTVGALKDLVPLALVLPGALLAAGAAFATLKIATAGFGDALKAGLSGDMAKFAEATKGMAPAMQAAAQAVVAFKPQIDDLKKSVQQDFWSKFAGDIGKLGANLLPTLKSGLSSVAAELGNMVKGAIAVASTPLFRGQLASILVSTRATIQNMAPALANVVAGFVALGAVGAKFLPSLGTAITDVTTKFRAWVDANDEAGGRIDQLIKTAIQSFKDLVDIVVNVGSVLNSIFRGLGGSLESPLATIKELTSRLAEFFRTAAAQDALRTLGELMREVGTIVGDILLAALGALADVWRELGPPIVEVVKALGAGLKPILPVIAGLLKDLATALAPIVRELAPVFKDVMQQVGDVLREAAPHFPKLVQAFSDLALKLIPLLPGLTQLAIDVLPSLVTAWEITADIIEGVLIPALDLILPAIQGVLDAFHFLALGAKLTWQTITGDFAGAAKTSDEILNFEWGKLPATGGKHLDSLNDTARSKLAETNGIFGAGLSGIGDIIGGAADKATIAFGDKLSAGFARAREIVAGVPGAMNTALSPIISLFSGTSTTSTNEFKAKTQAGFDQTRAIVAGVPGAMNQALSPIISLFSGTGTTSTNEFKAKTKAGFDQARAITASVPGSINSALSPLAGLLGTTGANAGNTFNSRLSGALNQAASAARAATAGIAGAISGALAGLGTVGANAGAAVGAGLVRGLNAQRSAVAGAAAGLGAVVAANKGPISKDRVMLVPAGIALVQGLIAGMNSQIPTLTSFSSGIAPQIAGALTSSGGLSISAPNTTGSALQQLLSLQSQQGVPQVRVFIGDRELTDLVRTEITSSNRSTRRTVTAGAGTTF